MALAASLRFLWYSVAIVAATMPTSLSLPAFLAAASWSDVSVISLVVALASTVPFADDDPEELSLPQAAAPRPKMATAATAAIRRVVMDPPHLSLGAHARSGSRSAARGDVLTPPTDGPSCAFLRCLAIVVKRRASVFR